MSAVLVVDTSLALKWVLDEPYTREARALLATWRAEEVRVLAPALLAYEAANAFHQRVRRGQLTSGVAEDILARLIRTGPELDFDATLVSRALQVAHRFGLSAAYDAQYLALAEREACECWTADERLWNAVKDRLPWVRWIGSRTAVRP